jgi:glutamate-1-semialdehyde 2,1-aminomutase
VSPLGSVYQAGTLSGNPVSINAGITMMKLIETENPYGLLEEIGKTVEAQFYEVAADKKIAIRVERVGSMFSVYFRKDKVESAADCRNTNEKQFNQYFWAMLDEGIMLPPSPFEAYFLATVHKPIVFGSEFKNRLAKVFSKISSAD